MNLLKSEHKPDSSAVLAFVPHAAGQDFAASAPQSHQ